MYKRQVYISAKYFVEESGFNCFSDLDDNERTKQMTIAKVCEIMTWQDQNIGILNKDGFNIDLMINENFLGQCITSVSYTHLDVYKRQSFRSINC